MVHYHQVFFSFEIEEVSCNLRPGVIQKCSWNERLLVGSGVSGILWHCLMKLMNCFERLDCHTNIFALTFV